MAESHRGSSSLLAELKRRHVFRVFAVYCAVAFLLLQIMDLVVPALLLPDWTYRLLALVLAVGLPIALIVAWAFEVTPDGVRKTGMPAEAATGAGATEPSSMPRLAVPVLVLLLVAAGWWVGRQGGPSPEPGTASVATADTPPRSDSRDDARVSIAVLPFENLSSDPEQDFFSDGISEELLNLLAKVHAFRVTARTSSFALRDENLTAVEIGDTLDITHLIEGSVRKDGDMVRVTVQLIETAEGSHLWSETWDRNLDGIFAVQDEIAADVLDQLHVTLLGGAPAVEATEPTAYGLVLQARHLVEQGDVESVREAERLYRAAVAIDPEYAVGWSELADLYLRPAHLNSAADVETSLALASESANRALALDPRQVTAISALGSVADIRGDLRAAAGHLGRAMEIDPGHLLTLQKVARLLGSLGRIEEQAVLLEYLVRRDPLSSGPRGALSRAYLALGRPADAVAAASASLAINPTGPGTWSALARAHLYEGNPEEALAAGQRETSVVSRLLTLAMVNHALGNVPESDAMVAELTSRHRGYPVNIAFVMAYRGDVDEAFAWLTRAAEEDDPGLTELFLWPQFEVLHDDPRWPAFLERIEKSPEDLESIEFTVTLPDGRTLDG